MIKNQWQGEELIRYSRQLLLPGFGLEGQAKLKRSRVLVVGAGGLGCPVLLYLAAAGVGTLGIVDGDKVQLNNLHRQILYTELDVGKMKVHQAAIRLKSLNGKIRINTYPFPLQRSNALELFARYDLIVDATDNFPTRYLINDAAVFSEKPFVYGAVYRYEGQVAFFNVKQRDGTRSPNYRDLYPQPPLPELIPDCAEGGVLGVLTGLVGLVQALEVIKFLTGVGELLTGKLWFVDGRNLQTRVFQFSADPENPVTGRHPTIHQLIDYEMFCCTAGAGSDTVPSISVETLFQWQKEKKRFLLVDVRHRFERELVSIGGKWIPFEELIRTPEPLPRDKPVVLYCRSGMRSELAIQRLQQEQGYTNLYNLDGGILKYLQKYHPEKPIY